MDPAPIWTDLKTFPWEDFCDRVDILTGGYPCQPFSAAGNRLGADDPRHLWPFIADGIRLLRPKLCFFENVDGHISLGLREVVEELESLGYTTTWGIFSASEVGAPHRRKRVFILAHANSFGVLGSGDSLGKISPCGQGGQDLASDSSLFIERMAAPVWPAGPSARQYDWEPPRVDRKSQSPLGRDTDEFTYWVDNAELYVSCDNRTDELRLLGNGVVPATAERAFRVLMSQLLG